MVSLSTGLGLHAHIKAKHPKWGKGEGSFKSLLHEYYERLHEREQANQQETESLKNQKIVEATLCEQDAAWYRSRMEQNGKLVAEQQERIEQAGEERTQIIRLLIAEYEANCAAVRRLEFALKSLRVKIMPKYLPSVVGDRVEVVE